MWDISQLVVLLSCGGVQYAILMQAHMSLVCKFTLSFLRFWEGLGCINCRENGHCVIDSHGLTRFSRTRYRSQDR